MHLLLMTLNKNVFAKGRSSVLTSTRGAILSSIDEEDAITKETNDKKIDVRSFSTTVLRSALS